MMQSEKKRDIRRNVSQYKLGIANERYQYPLQLLL